MKRITAHRVGRGPKKQINIFLDGKLAIGPGAEGAAQEAPPVQTLEPSSPSHRPDSFQHCYNAATRYLSYRPRSESELRERLRQRGSDDNSIRAVIAKLKEQGLLDDATFAKFWKDNRETFSPRSRWLTTLELRRKGVANEIIVQTVQTMDDKDCAYRAALNKARTLSGTDYEPFVQKLGGYLKRRGFSYSVINQTVEQLWQDRAAGTI